MKPNRAIGYDELSVNILKLSAINISKCLATIVNSSLNRVYFPSYGKMEKSHQIFKGAPVNDRDNYRPISVLSALAKVYEGVADNQVKDYGENHRTLKEPLQFPYTKHCSTTTALIKV